MPLRLTHALYEPRQFQDTGRRLECWPNAYLLWCHCKQIISGNHIRLRVCHTGSHSLLASRACSLKALSFRPVHNQLSRTSLVKGRVGVVLQKSKIWVFSSLLTESENMSTLFDNIYQDQRIIAAISKPNSPIEVPERIQSANLVELRSLPKLTTLQEIELDQGLRPLESGWRL